MTNKTKTNNVNKIILKGAREHNLKNIDLEIQKNKLVVFTGVSGSGKSSLVFDTIYAEGQRRFVESLSSYARQFLERMNKPDLDFIHGISPAVAIEQKTGSRNPRSTVGTSTEVYDYLRLLFARIGVTFCFECGNIVKKDSVSTITQWMEEQEDESKFYMSFPIHQHEGRKISDELSHLIKRGFYRIFYKDHLIDLNETYDTPKSKDEIFVVVERLKIKKDRVRELFADSIEVTLKEGEGKLVLINAETFDHKNFNTAYECCGIKYNEPEPRFFSFNNPYGACPVCQGFGKTIGLDFEKVIPNEDLT
ncbi:MAG: excinuclease ABC subunit A, partial [Ignavibacteriae bacterium]|nr:excinuclease ABC subunit A [Ignavibacteriota bacterium]